MENFIENLPTLLEWGVQALTLILVIIKGKQPQSEVDKNIKKVTKELKKQDKIKAKIKKLEEKGGIKNGTSEDAQGNGLESVQENC